MLKNYKFVNRGMLIALMGVLGVIILIKGLFAAEDFISNACKFSPTGDYSSEIEKQIRAGVTSTADLIVDSHPRVWMRGKWDWDHNNYGSFAWRIAHGEPLRNADPANDQAKFEFGYIFRAAQDGIYGGTYYSKRFLYTIIAAEAVARDSEWNIPHDLPGNSRNPDYDPQYSEDDFLASAVDKLVERSKTSLSQEGPYERVVEASVGYDWLADRKFSDGVTPVMTEAKRVTIQNNIIAIAEYLRNKAKGSGQLFDSADLSDYLYVMAGLALYEPSGQGISPENNAKAKQYLDEFDQYWIGKILPALNEQGGTGGWHGGLCETSDEFDYLHHGKVLTYSIAPILFAHYTATKQSYENSVFSTGALKYAIEFQNHMVYPDGQYLDLGNRGGDDRYIWIAPMFPNARRRFSSDPEQRRLGELIGWFRCNVAPDGYVNGGSWCMFDQLMWEEKWPNPRPPWKLELGTTRHFAKLGWVCMRSGFTSRDDLAALFICQRYHWSNLNPYAQNSFSLERKGKLIEGYHNTIWLDDLYQRDISGFPTITEGVEVYQPGSKYDVGPGIQAFGMTDECDYMIGDATNAYDSNKLEKFTRGLVWVQTNNTFIMFDRVVTKSEATKKSWVIDPGATPQANGEKLVKITNGSGALWIKRLLPEQATETMNGSRFEVVPKSSAKESYFLHVMQAVDASLSKDSPEVVADEAQLVTQGDQIGVRFGDWEILFSRSNSTQLWINGTSIQRTELNSFEAALNGESVLLKWQTSSEFNNKGFEIERGLNWGSFDKIGFVKAQGTSFLPQSYQFLDNTVSDGRYYYRLKQLTSDGTFKYSSVIEIAVGHSSTGEITVRLPYLFNNYPNPFNPLTEICYNLPYAVEVDLSIFNVYGQHVITLVREKQPAGERIVKWNGKDKNNMNVPGGMYFYRLKAGEFSATKKMILIH